MKPETFLGFTRLWRPRFHPSRATKSRKTNPLPKRQRSKRPRTKHAAWAVATPPFGSLSRPKGLRGRYRPVALIPCQVFCPRSPRTFENSQRQHERRTACPLSRNHPRPSLANSGLESLWRTPSYAQVIGSTADHVVASALRFVFWKDKEFDRLQKEQRKARKSNEPGQVKKA